MTRILVYPADDSRSGRRLSWPAEVLAAQGADIVIANRHDQDDHANPVWNDRYDVIVLQRPMLRRYVESYWDEDGYWTEGEAIQRLQADGMKIVIDIDDDFMALNRRNAVWDRTHPSQSPNCNWHHLSTACRLADLVTVTTPALARRYGSHGRVVVIPNHVPESYLKIERPKNDVPIVGWTGAVATHPDDLQVTRGGVARAVEGSGARFYMVGPVDGVQANLGLSQPVVASGFVPIEDYPYEMSKIDVGIVPLELSAFNQAKSYLKGLEFAALGIPFVSSPTDPYLEIPAGLTAAKPKDWERLVSRLLTDRGLYLGLMANGMQWAATQTVEANAHLWGEAWESVSKRRERRTACVSTT